MSRPIGANEIVRREKERARKGFGPILGVRKSLDDPFEEIRMREEIESARGTVHQYDYGRHHYE